MDKKQFERIAGMYQRKANEMIKEHNGKYCMVEPINSADEYDHFKVLNEIGGLKIGLELIANECKFQVPKMDLEKLF